jgi:hypothetical protein
MFDMLKIWASSQDFLILFLLAIIYLLKNLFSMVLD